MSSVYNMRLTCAEYWVEGTKLQQIRKPLNLMTYLEQFNCEQAFEKPMNLSPNLQTQQRLPLIQKDNCSSYDSQSSKKRLRKQGSFSSKQVKSALDIESIAIIDECDEENSPDRGNNQNLKYKFESHSEVQLRNLSANVAYRSAEDRNKKSDEYSFYMESSQSSESYKEQKLEDNSDNSESGLSEDSHSYDSEEEDRKFLEKQQEEQMKKEFQQLDEKPSKIPFALDNIFKKKEIAKFTPEVEEDQYDDEFGADAFQSPTFAKKGPITPQKITHLNNTVKKEGIQLIKSPVKFMSQRKMGRPAPFEIKTINYNYEDFREMDDEEMSLTQNNGGEIDVKQLTGIKKYGTTKSIDMDLKSSSIATYMNRGSFSAIKTPDPSANTPDRVVVRSQFPSSSQDVCKLEGIKGLGSAGIRLGGNRIQNVGSSTSSRRDAFRNRILQNKAGIGSFEQFNKFKMADGNSSVGSRYVTKLQGNDSDAEIMSQQEQEYKNAFEKTYDEYEALGEGCSSVVKRCEHKFLKQIRAVKIIRNDDPEYIQNAQNEYQILKNINNNLIVKMYDCIHDYEKGTLYLIMEFIEGETIEDYVLRIQNEKKGSIPESIVKKIFKQIVLAVEICHGKSICHRDLKPDNVLYNPKTENIKLMDFNISKRFRKDAKIQVKPELITPIRKKTGDVNQIMGISLQNQLNKPMVDFDFDELKDEEEEEDESQPKRITMRTLTGLDMYSAPETRQGGDYTEAIDYWGIGILLFFIVTGHPPFIDHDENRLKLKVQNCQYEPINQECLNTYSRECFELIKNLIVVDPEKRFNLQQIKESVWYNTEIQNPTTPKKKASQSLRKISEKLPMMEYDNKKNQESAVEVIRPTLQPTLEIKKRDPAVIRNRQDNSRKRRDIADRKQSFLIPTGSGSAGVKTPNLFIRGLQEMPDQSDQKRGGSINKLKSLHDKNDQTPKQGDNPSKQESLIKLFQITPQGGYSSDEELEPDEMAQSISFSNQNQKYIKQNTHNFRSVNIHKKDLTSDSGYELERGITFDFDMQKQLSLQKMPSKLRKKSHKSKIGKQALDIKMKRKQHREIDEKKVYKECSEKVSPLAFQEDSPSSLNEETMDNMLLDQKNNQ